MGLKVSQIGSLSRNFQIFERNRTAFLLQLLEEETELEEVTTWWPPPRPDPGKKTQLQGYRTPRQGSQESAETTHQPTISSREIPNIRLLSRRKREAGSSLRGWEEKFWALIEPHCWAVWEDCTAGLSVVFSKAHDGRCLCAGDTPVITEPSMAEKIKAFSGPFTTHLISVLNLRVDGHCVG